MKPEMTQPLARMVLQMLTLYQNRGTHRHWAEVVMILLLSHQMMTDDQLQQARPVTGLGSVLLLVVWKLFVLLELLMLPVQVVLFLVHDD